MFHVCLCIFYWLAGCEAVPSVSLIDVSSMDVQWLYDVCDSLWFPMFTGCMMYVVSLVSDMDAYDVRDFGCIL